MIDTINPYRAPLGSSVHEASAECAIGEDQAILQYDLMPEDLATWQTNDFHFFRSLPCLSMWLLILALFLLPLALTWIGWPAPVMLKTLTTAMVGVPVLFGWLLMPIGYRKRLHALWIERYRNELEQQGGYRHVTCNSNGIVSMSDRAMTVYRWRGVSAIVAAPQAIYVYVSKSSAIIIPRRALGTDENSEQFLRLVDKLRNA